MLKEAHIFKVSVPAPIECHVTAERNEVKGGWSYERGTTRIKVGNLEAPVSCGSFGV